MNSITRGERRSLYIGFAVLGALFWAGIFGTVLYMVGELWSYEGVGPYLSRKLLEMLLASLFTMLCFSNVITALSVFYLSDDLELILALPLSRPTFHYARFIDATIQSSWMMLLFGVPVFCAYGLVSGSAWTYFLATAVAVPALLLIATSFGVTFATVLVNVFPARRTRELMVLMGAMMLAALFVLFRTLRPERLVNAEGFDSFASYLADIQLPAPILFPPRWASEWMGRALLGSPTPWAEVGLLVFGALASMSVARWATSRGFDAGWARAQEARSARFYKSRVFDIVVRVLPTSWRPIAAKEIRVFVRDPAQWSQIFLLVGLCAIYLVSVQSLPLSVFKGSAAQVVREAITFLNLGMGGFVMAAIAGRFQFTAVSREGRAWWIMRGAPVMPLTVLRAKSAFGLVPMLIVGEVVVVGSGIVLDARTEVLVGEALLTILLAWGISGIATAMGAWWPDFSAENAARAAASPAAMLFMVVAQTLVFVVLALFVLFGYLFVVGRTGLSMIPAAMAVLLCLFAGSWPQRRAAESLWQRGLTG